MIMYRVSFVHLENRIVLRPNTNGHPVLLCDTRPKNIYGTQLKQPKKFFGMQLKQPKKYFWD